jgi:predicted metal-dependent hydrolase
VSIQPAQVEIRRSARRHRSVSAYRDGDKIVVLVPARLSSRQESRIVADLVDRISQREARTSLSGAKASDSALLVRAGQLSADFLDSAATPASIRWVSNMAHRWGSCTNVDATIRISDRLRPFPSWVLDYVVVHELAHLLQPGHDAQFWKLVNRYPLTERARGFLEGVSLAGQLSGSTGGSG